MELILLEDVEKVGFKGDVVRVKDGFARNYLIPRTLAFPATRKNREFVEEQRARSEKRRAKAKAEATKKAEKMNQVKLNIEAKAGEQDKLFGSVTAEDVCEALKTQGYEYTKKQVHLKEPIRSLGTHSVSVEVFPEVKATITVEVTAAAQS